MKTKSIKLDPDHLNLQIALLNRCQLLEALIYTCDDQYVLSYVTEYVETFQKSMELFQVWSQQYEIPPAFFLTNMFAWEGKYVFNGITGTSVPVPNKKDLLVLFKLSTAILAWNQLIAHMNVADSTARCEQLMHLRLEQTSISTSLLNYFPLEAVERKLTWGVDLHSQALLIATPSNKVLGFPKLQFKTLSF